VVTVPLFFVPDYNIYNTDKVTNVLIGATLELNYNILQPVQ
jgi:hypothetical protein